MKGLARGGGEVGVGDMEVAGWWQILGELYLSLRDDVFVEILSVVSDIFGRKFFKLKHHLLRCRTNVRILVRSPSKYN